MKKTLLVLLAAAGLSSAAFAQDFKYDKGDVLVGFRSSDPARSASTGIIAGSEKAYLVNLGQRDTVANYTTNWAGINLSNDLITVFGANWASTTTWGMLSIPLDRKSWAASAAEYSLATIESKPPQFLATPTAMLGNIGTAFDSLSIETGDAATAGKLSQGVWGTNDDLPWSTSVEDNSFGVGNFETASSSNLNLYIAYGNTFGAVGNALRGKTVNANTFSIVDGTVMRSVPEPSTYALFGFAALLLIVAYRRANA